MVVQSDDLSRKSNGGRGEKTFIPLGIILLILKVQYSVLGVVCMQFSGYTDIGRYFSKPDELPTYITFNVINLIILLAKFKN